VSLGDDAAITIVPHAMRGLPDDLEGWVAGLMAVELPAGGAARLAGMVARATDKGWPWRLVDASVVREGIVVERRLGGFYRFFEYGGFALARAAGSDLDPRRADEVIAILATAEPDWSSEVVAVHQLWDPA
jgi:hypothetical protein